jgi:DNA-binding MarR family transcriptional regulator
VTISSRKESRERGILETVVRTRDLLLETWHDLREAVERIDALLWDTIETETGLGAAESEVVARLLNEPGHAMPMTRLADEVSFSSGGFTKLADRLETDGLIERRADPADRRVRNAALTPEGERLARLAMALVIRGLRGQLLAPLSEDGVRTLAALLARLAPSDVRA